MEGKELRFGIADSSLFIATTTAATGSVNTMHDSLRPMGGFIALAQMMLNCVFGGGNVGLYQPDPVRPAHGVPGGHDDRPLLAGIPRQGKSEPVNW